VLIFPEGLFQSHEAFASHKERAVIAMEDFSAFLDMRRYKNWVLDVKLRAKLLGFYQRLHSQE